MPLPIYRFLRSGHSLAVNDLERVSKTEQARTGRQCLNARCGCMSCVKVEVAALGSPVPNSPDGF